MQDTQIGSAQPGGTDIVLELKGVSKRFGAARAVDDVSLQVRRGEVTTILGASGSGLTTLLRLAVGLERVTLGEIIYARKSVDSPASKIFVPSNERNMGMVFQSYAIWPHMTVAENVAYPLKVRKATSPEVREQVSRVLEQVGLGGMEQRSATALSQEDLQRVAVARSLVFKPDLLLLDEPFSNVAPHLRENMRTEFRILQQRLGITVLLATHDPIEALSVSDCIAVMNEGKIEQVDTPVQLYREPSSPLVRDLLGRTVVLQGMVAETGVPGSLGVRLHDQTGPVVYTQRQSDRGLNEGDDCLLAMRAASVEVEPLDSVSDPDALNTLRGVIATLLFVGDRFEARVQLPWGDEVSLHLPADDRWREGLPVAIRLAAQELQVWPAPAPPPAAEEPIVEDDATPEETEEPVVEEDVSPEPTAEPLAAPDSGGDAKISE